MPSEWTNTCNAARVQEGETLADILEPGLKLDPDKVAVYFEDRTLTYRELDEAANRVADGLVKAGVQPGDRVSMHADNRPEFIFIHIGLLRAGALFVPASIMYTGEEIEYILNDSGAKALFILSGFAHKLENIETHNLEHVIEIGGDTLQNATSLDAFMAKADPIRPAVTIDPDATANIQYTSGTTGRPKGAMISHANVLAVLHAMSDLPGTPPGEKTDVTLIVIPVFHAFALNLGLTRPFLAVQSIVLVHRFDPERIFSLFERYRVTHFLGAPPMYFGFVNTPGLEKHDVSSLRVSFSGGAPLPVVNLEKFRALTGIEITEGYGLSETAPSISTNMAAPANKPGSVGHPIPCVTVRLVDENDQDVPDGEVGEIVAQGPNIFAGYWNKEEETAEAMRSGWFHTGDMGRFDEDGYLYIVDRKKDMIVVSGFNVYPIELENVILRHPKIVDCAVIGIPDDYQGESVKAVLVLANDESIDLDEFQVYCREHMAAFKIPKQLSIRDALPKNPTGKTLKRVLREQEGGITKAKT